MHECYKYTHIHHELLAYFLTCICISLHLLKYTAEENSGHLYNLQIDNSFWQQKEIWKCLWCLIFNVEGVTSSKVNKKKKELLTRFTANNAAVTVVAFTPTHYLSWQLFAVLLGETDSPSICARIQNGALGSTAHAAKQIGSFDDLSLLFLTHTSLLHCPLCLLAKFSSSTVTFFCEKDLA